MPPVINTNILSRQSPIESGSYKLSSKCFFQQSKLFEAQITELFDNFWPMVTALKTLRWQVNGYYHQNGIQSNDRLNKKFIEEEDKANRPNLYRACLEKSWEDWEGYLAGSLLTNMLALYEGWLEMIIPKLSIPSERVKCFQYPTDCSRALARIQRGGNTTIIDAFYDVYKNNNKQYNLTHLDNYLKLFRYFKNCRNCIIHNGYVSNQELVDAYSSVSTFTETDIDVEEVPKMDAVTTLYTPFKLYLRGVVGFSQILLKMMYTLDVEFIKARNNEVLLIESVKEHNQCPLCPSANPSKRKRIVLGVFRRAGFLNPIYSSDLSVVLTNNRVLNL